jgi:hypothetical protein
MSAGRPASSSDRGVGEHLGTAEPPTPTQPESAEAPRLRPDTPSTGRASRERARRATTGPGRVGLRACDHQIGAFPDARRRVSRRTADHRSIALRSGTPPGCSPGPGLSWARRSRPGPPGARPPAPGRRRVDPVHLGASPSGAGWVGCPTGSCGCSGGRPRRGGTPVLDETAAVRVPLDWLWSRSRPRATAGSWGVISGIRTGATPLRLVSRSCGSWTCAALPQGVVRSDHPGAGLGCGGSGPQPVKWHPTGDGLVRNGRAPSRGRPPTQPHDSVVHPTRPLPQGDRVEANGREHARGPDPRGAPGGPGRERRAHRQRPDQTDPMDRHDRA